MTSHLAAERKFACDIYPRRDLQLQRGKNAWVIDDKGRRYIDCVAGHGVASVGHSHPRVVAAISRQAGRLITCSGVFYNDIRSRLLEKIVGLTGGSLQKVFLCNSGAEAIEAAIKFSRFATGKENFICARRGFHGRTMGALSATFNPRYKRDFEPLVPGFLHIPFNDFEAVEQMPHDHLAAVILEVVQGEGGVHVASREYMKQVRRWCNRHGILLILDEVQTGFCRTGRMFAFQHMDIEPDLLCVAKAMAGGVPMGAVVCRRDIPVPRGNHGSTFGGNPLACAASLAAIEVMEVENLALAARRKGEVLLKHLRSLSSDRIREVRGLGLMIGIELTEKVKPYLLDLMDRGVLALPAGKNVLRLLPPLTIEPELLHRVVEAIGQSLK